ncbi:MAG TPA: hypothetical protein VK085_08480 [Pseudogracilibacillus sp.]|nr:hypothetical protein [Pseudogracilibacillus sp.]
MSENHNHNKHLGYGISFGLIGGALLAVLLGSFFNTMLVWAFAPGFGMLLGMMVGIIMDANHNKG